MEIVEIEILFYQGVGSGATRVQRLRYWGVGGRGAQRSCQGVEIGCWYGVRFNA